MNAGLKVVDGQKHELDRGTFLLTTGILARTGVYTPSGGYTSDYGQGAHTRKEIATKKQGVGRPGCHRRNSEDDRTLRGYH